MSKAILHKNDKYMNILKLNIPNTFDGADLLREETKRWSIGTLTENPVFSDTQESVFILESIRSCSDKQQYEQQRAGEGDDRG